MPKATAPLLAKRVSRYLHMQVYAARKDMDITCPVCQGPFCCEADHMTLACGHALHWACACESADLKVCPVCRP